MRYTEITDESGCLQTSLSDLKMIRVFTRARLNEKRALACVASVSVLFRSKERPRNEILGFGRARNETRGKLAPFFARPLLRNSTETLATQAKRARANTIIKIIKIARLLYFRFG